MFQYQTGTPPTAARPHMLTDSQIKPGQHYYNENDRRTVEIVEWLPGDNGGRWLVKGLYPHIPRLDGRKSKVSPTTLARFWKLVPAPTSDAPASSPDAASEGGRSVSIGDLLVRCGAVSSMRPTVAASCLAPTTCPCGAPATKPATTRGAGLCDDCQFDLLGGA